MSGKKYVPDGVWLTCNCGACYSVFKVTFHKMADIYGSNMATEGDRLPFLNIKPMGLCSNKMSLCVPSPVLWKDPKQGIMIGFNRMLLEDSTAMCLFGGTIQIHFTLEAAKAACPFGSLKRPSEYIKDGFDWVFNNMNSALSDLRGGLAKAGAPNWLLNGVDLLAWKAQFSVGVVEGAINAVVGLGEVIWDITQDPVGIGTAIVEGVSDGATKAWNWASKAENWEKAAESSWDYVTSPDKWAETAKDAADWVQDNPRKIGNVAGEVLETAAEIALTAGTATAAKAAGKVTKEVVEEVVEKTTKEIAEKAAKEVAEKAAKELGEDGVQKSLPKVITKEGAEKTPTRVSKVKEIFDPKTATNKQKGNFGEMAAYDNKVSNQALKDKGYDLKRIGVEDAPNSLDDKIKKGIDGIYENATPPPKYVIDEAKYGTSQLGMTKDGPQMSDDWIKGSNRIEKQFPE
ncbi:hypothetical protein AGMMS50239_40220 [Bacteroidia bacterium]|nr:hypothetical protein AGMMS50239_40220 [Bacteroidia bacterium]